MGIAHARDRLPTQACLAKWHPIEKQRKSISFPRNMCHMGIFRADCAQCPVEKF